MLLLLVHAFRAANRPPCCCMPSALLTKCLLGTACLPLLLQYYLKRCGLRTIYYLLEGDIDLLPNGE